MQLNNPDATRAALELLRSGNPFQWYVITLLALVLYIYANEIGKKNWNGIAAGLSLYMVHWAAEIINGLIQHFSGHALWTVPTGTAFLLLIGVGVELSFMFSIAGIVLSKLLPEEIAGKEEQKKYFRNLKFFGIHNRYFFAVANAAFFSIFEILLVKTPTFVWVYPWWGALPVFIMVYIPFFVIAFFCYGAKPKAQNIIIGSLFTVNIFSLVLFAGILKWI